MILNMAGYKPSSGSGGGGWQELTQTVRSAYTTTLTFPTGLGHLPNIMLLIARASSETPDSSALPVVYFKKGSDERWTALCSVNNTPYITYQGAGGTSGLITASLSNRDVQFTCGSGCTLNPGNYELYFTDGDFAS